MHVVSKKANRRPEDAKVNGKGKTHRDAPVTWPLHLWRRVASACVLLLDTLPLLLLCIIYLSRSTISATTLTNMM
jgi:hypothetical protein